MGPMYIGVENIYLLSWTSSQMRNEKGLSMVAFCPTTFLKSMYSESSQSTEGSWAPA